MKKPSCFFTGALSAVALAILLFARCEQPTEADDGFPEVKAVDITDAEGLESALGDDDVREITIQGDIDGRTLDLTVKAGQTKVINTTGGKETAISSLELKQGSHVTIAGPAVLAEQGNSLAALGALSVMRSETGASATLVVWDHFVIEDDATFDLVGQVRLIFRSSATAEVNGTLTAESEEHIAWMAAEGGGESGTDGNTRISGTGKVKINEEEFDAASEDLAAKIPDAAGYTPVFTPEAPEKRSPCYRRSRTGTRTVPKPLRRSR